MALFRKTRGLAGEWLYVASIIFGLATWFLGASVTFYTWGWTGFLIGVFLAGVGVVPIGIAAAFFSLHDSSLGISLIIMSIIVFATRAGSWELRVHSDDE